jgi:hypothetical protein
MNYPTPTNLIDAFLHKRDYIIGFLSNNDGLGEFERQKRLAEIEVYESIVYWLKKVRAQEEPVYIYRERAKAITFKDEILDIFHRHNRPLTSPEIVNLLNKNRGSNEDLKKISPQLSFIVNKRNVLKKQVVKHGRFYITYYGLYDYFDGENFKPEYLEKIPIF